MKTLTFEQVIQSCRMIAKALECMIEIKDVNEYGFGIVDLGTDNFGGTAVHLSYDAKNGDIVDWRGNSDETKIESLPQLLIHVTKAVVDMQHERNTEEVYDFINSQY